MITDGLDDAKGAEEPTTMGTGKSALLYAAAFAKPRRSANTPARKSAHASSDGRYFFRCFEMVS